MTIAQYVLEGKSVFGHFLGDQSSSQAPFVKK